MNPVMVKSLSNLISNLREYFDMGTTAPAKKVGSKHELQKVDPTRDSGTTLNRSLRKDGLDSKSQDAAFKIRRDGDEYSS